MYNYLTNLVINCNDDEFSFVYDIAQACRDTGLISHNDYYQLCSLLEKKAKSICNDVREEVKRKNNG
jgi:hypothetical protein